MKKWFIHPAVKTAAWFVGWSVFFLGLGFIEVMIRTVFIFSKKEFEFIFDRHFDKYFIMFIFWSCVSLKYKDYKAKISMKENKDTH